ncbi:MAG: glyceraldehyde-3-phosphate dehydrogenase [Deltaproteobacteria bacterium]|jgi:glyceraldehyde 3-phosphate dehydrogenase|nr:glyceraldehyde-3-phosphate dehydrogenase [Deltaproteobacteria bacterium]MBT4264181.1 glyceraldehyde-3-phosphate dehydrogenase [Deltaproteobacteria bacterium]MBT4642810.1 glyceraldehyde-3-phosphate dehydrogenase [Deltaproteobacteria bacterium]MBT6499311.1 glyceraldehyde-3-phosphate dehydrogenase [Deltaproteobacteria bacterium]MBT7155608.1 glyceraldehyde-3-phosphate dehydrogenase [Deltaproteobacteria bacterium]
MSETQQDSLLSDWQTREALSESALHLIGKLYREQGIVSLIYGRPVVNFSPIELIKAHRFVRQIEKMELSIHDSFPILEAISKLNLPPVQIDFGMLTSQYLRSGKTKDPAAFVQDQLSDIIGQEDDSKGSPQDVVLYGFGRVGRLIARLLIEQTGRGNRLRLRAIIVRKGAVNDLQKRASLLRRDSVHGNFKGTIQVDEAANAIIANGNFIHVIYSDSPNNLDYTSYGIDNALIIDNTGIWRTEEGLSLHLESKGAARVLLTAPGKDKIKNIVFGINHTEIKAEDRILSAASCTTNAIVPVLKAVNDKFGIINGHLETIHAYTNDQNLLDNYHKHERRGRSGPLNMILTNTGAAKAVAKALPELAGKLTGNAIRVPTPNVSMAMLSLNFEKGTTKEELNQHLRYAALHSELRDQIDYTTSTEVASTDMVGSRFACVVDSSVTIAQDNRCVLYLWYDNEFGYSCQVVRIIQQMSGIKTDVYPKS